MRTPTPTTVDQITAEKMKLSERLARLDADREKIAVQLADLETAERHCQLKRPWYAPRVGGAVARVGELLCSPIVLPGSAERGRKKAPSVR